MKHAHLSNQSMHCKIVRSHGRLLIKLCLFNDPYQTGFFGRGYTVQCSVSILVTRDREKLNQGQRQYKGKIEAMVVAVEVNEG